MNRSANSSEIPLWTQRIFKARVREELQSPTKLSARFQIAFSPRAWAYSIGLSRRFHSRVETAVLKIRKYQFYRPKSKITLSLPRCTTFETKIKEKKSVIYFNTNYGKWHATIKRETAVTRSTSISTFLCESVKKCFNDRRIDRDAARKRDQPRGREKFIEKYTVARVKSIWPTWNWEIRIRRIWEMRKREKYERLIAVAISRCLAIGARSRATAITYDHAFSAGWNFHLVHRVLRWRGGWAPRLRSRLGYARNRDPETQFAATTWHVLLI